MTVSKYREYDYTQIRCRECGVVIHDDQVHPATTIKLGGETIPCPNVGRSKYEFVPLEEDKFPERWWDFVIHEYVR